MPVAVFDEAMTVLRHGVPEADHPNWAILETASSSTNSYLQTLSGAFISPSDEPPPSPDLDRLREAGVPTVADEAFADCLDDLRDRRRKLLGTVHADAWHWPPVEDR